MKKRGKFTLTKFIVNKKEFGNKKRVNFIKRLRCLNCNSWPSDCTHTKSRGAGGTYKDIINLCHKCHMELHTIGIQTFENKYDLNLKVEAERLCKYLDTLYPVNIGSTLIS